jgi:site-specific DNA recombinase
MAMARSPAKLAGPQVRCAIYTRKSSEEGLEQDFNSLDAQREACEAFVLSQKHEGWVALPAMYDDGGFSGANIERPAFRRLLSDIEAGRIDAVVVYKVDRLTRSLGDFAKIVEVFDRRGVSFVSVTQQFNTTSSMGRLTLNMLLSFAQFEREVTGERIRDKVAASKRKGMWMGGLPPLGYDVRERKLVVNEPEAQRVRHIYRRYAALGSVWDLKDELDRDGIVSKERVDRFGRKVGGKPLARGALYLMLQNRIYRGEIVHKDASYPGEHKPIIDQALWGEVQRRLAANRVERATGAKAAQPSLLAGLICDEAGERLVPSHANKKGRRYRYYVSKGLVTGAPANPQRGRRVPAADLEGLVENRLRQFLASATEVFGALSEIMAAGEAQSIVARAAELAGQWPSLPPDRKRAILMTLVDRIELGPETLEIRIRPRRLPDLFDDETLLADRKPTRATPERIFALSIPARLRRAGMEMRLLIEGPSVGARKKPDHSLQRLLAQAHHFQDVMMRGAGRTMDQIAAEAGVSGSYFTRILRLSFLAPDLVQAILRDRHPIALTAKRLAIASRLPILWEDQRSLLASELIQSKSRTQDRMRRPCLVIKRKKRQGSPRSRRLATHRAVPPKVP